MFNTFSPSPFMNAYPSPMAMYAGGGHVHPYHQEAEMLRHLGTGRDRVLAHINPAEASYLSQHHGMSINPHTGLPQFGFFDTVRSGLGRVGSGLGRAAMAAAPMAWDFARPLVQEGLGALDTRIQEALPGYAQSLGTRFGGERGGALAQSLGQSLANQFGQYGGLSGQITPRIDARAGFEGPTQYPQFGRGDIRDVARTAAQDVWKNTGRGMVGRGIQNVDEGIMRALPQVGSRIGGALGSRFGMGQRGATMGSNIGSAIGSRYGETSGIGGYAMPRLNQAVQNIGMPSIPAAPPPPPMSAAPFQAQRAFHPSDIQSVVPMAMAHGGYMHHPYYHY
jgi:hypothetical protein